MAARTILQTNTLEEFRIQFNALSQQDFGDIGTLDSSISATSIVGAMNELVSIVGANEGFFIEDETSSQQLIGAGQRLKVFGATNECTAVVSASDTLTIGLADDINVQTINAPGTGNQTIGKLRITNSDITTTDNSTIEIQQDLTVLDTKQINLGSVFDISKDPTSGHPIINSNSAGEFMLFNGNPVLVDNEIRFEGTTIDTNDTKLTAVDPTQDNTITLPNATGTVALTNATGYATGSIFTSSSTLIIYDSSGSAVKTIVGSAT